MTKAAKTINQQGKSKLFIAITAATIILLILFLAPYFSTQPKENKIVLKTFNNYVKKYNGNLNEIEQARQYYNSVELTDANFNIKVWAAKNYVNTANRIIPQMDELKKYIYANQNLLDESGVNTAELLSEIENNKAIIKNNAQERYQQLQAYSAQKAQQQELLLTLFKLIVGLG